MRKCLIANWVRFRIVGTGTSIHSFWVGYTIKRGKKEYDGTNNIAIDKNVIRIWQRKIIKN